MDQLYKRNPKKEIIKKIIIAIASALLFLVIYALIYRINITSDEFGLMFFLLGGIFFVIGGIRDLTESISVKKIRGDNLSVETDKESHLYGFGETGEDFLTGAFLIILALICWSIEM